MFPRSAGITGILAGLSLLLACSHGDDNGNPSTTSLPDSTNNTETTTTSGNTGTGTTGTSTSGTCTSGTGTTGTSAPVIPDIANPMATLSLSGDDAANLGATIGFSQLIDIASGVSWAGKACDTTQVQKCNSQTMSIIFSQSNSFNLVSLTIGRDRLGSIASYDCVSSQGANCIGLSIDSTNQLITFNDVKLNSKNFSEPLTGKLFVNGTLSYAGATIPDTASNPIDVNARWLVLNTPDYTNGNCAYEKETPMYEVILQQTDNTLTVTAPMGILTGSINGKDLQWSASYPYLNGTVQISELNLRSVSNDTFMGNSTWSWFDAADTCDAKSVVTMVRKTPPSVTGGVIDLSGTEVAAFGPIVNAKFTPVQFSNPNLDFVYQDAFAGSHNSTLTIKTNSDAVEQVSFSILMSPIAGDGNLHYYKCAPCTAITIDISTRQIHFGSQPLTGLAPDTTLTLNGSLSTDIANFPTP